MTRPSRILIAVLGITIVLAVADTLVPGTTMDPRVLDIVASTSFAICAFAWVKADARERQREHPPGSALLAALIIPIGIPLYFFRAFGARRGFLATAKFLGFLVVLVGTYFSVTHVVDLLRRVEVYSCRGDGCWISPMVYSILTRTNDCWESSPMPNEIDAVTTDLEG
jgi:hypothetical protein